MSTEGTVHSGNVAGGNLLSQGAANTLIVLVLISNKKIRNYKMAKPSTIKIRLNSTADTGHFYVTKKNSRTMTEKMVVKKFDPVARKHVEYKEGKIK